MRSLLGDEEMFRTIDEGVLVGSSHEPEFVLRVLHPHLQVLHHVLVVLVYPT